MEPATVIGIAVVLTLLIIFTVYRYYYSEEKKKKEPPAPPVIPAPEPSKLSLSNMSNEGAHAISTGQFNPGECIDGDLMFGFPRRYKNAMDCYEQKKKVIGGSVAVMDFSNQAQADPDIPNCFVYSACRRFKESTTKGYRN